MDIKNITLKPRTVQAVQFTGDNFEELRQWVQDKSPFQRVTATSDRFYLPSVGQYVEVLEPGDWVLYDRVDGGFRAATNEAIENFYEEVPTSEVTP